MPANDTDTGNSNLMPSSSSVRYLYSAWFRDGLAHAEDEDFEWVACFVVQAKALSDAQRWGDHLSLSMSRRRGTETFLRSHVEPADRAAAMLPVVVEGYEATDTEIGW